MKVRRLTQALDYFHTIPNRFSGRHETLSCIVLTPIRYVTLHFRDRRCAASLRYRNRAEITEARFRYGFRAGAKSVRWTVNIADLYYKGQKSE